jgi:cell division protease FtsH
VRVLLERGLARLNGSYFDDSVGYFDEAIRLDPTNAKAWFHRGLAWHHLEGLERAISNYDEAIRLDPTLARAYSHRACLRSSMRGIDESIADATRVIELEPQSADGYRLRARFWFQSEAYENAATDLRRVLEIDPNDAASHYLAGLTLCQFGRIDEALRAFDAAIRLDPRMVEAFRKRGQLLRDLGRAEESFRDFERTTPLENDTLMTTASIKKKTLIAPLISNHFAPRSTDELTIVEREFPSRIRVDLQRAIDGLLGGIIRVHHFSGAKSGQYRNPLELSSLISPDYHDAPVAVPAPYEEVDIGEDTPVRCVRRGLWLLEEDSVKFVVFLESRDECGRRSALKIEVAAAGDEAGARTIQKFFRRLEEAVARSETYRGKILSLGASSSYSGESTGILVHRLDSVRRDEVILPKATLDLLDRNVIEFARQRQRLAQLGLSTKKGLLFYGPPGTGKTHTIRYLAKALAGHTTLLMAAEHARFLDGYMQLARLLQPSIVVIEDVDLIARDRDSSRGPYDDSLLHSLLNEMDGLRRDADVFFILTTNRPRSLEAALASRPGRIDQAIEFPFPDDEGRAKLIRLYGRGLSISDEAVHDIVKRTENVSAAFIRELMRRAAQFRFERDEAATDTELADFHHALDELLVSGGSLHRRLLGAEFAEDDEE